MAKYVKDGISFDRVTEPIVLTYGGLIGRGQYNKDNEGNIIAGDEVINAIDIDWNDAKIPSIPQKISSTSQLLSIIGELYAHSKTDDGIRHVILSPEEYEALDVHEPNVLYFITGDIEEEEYEEPDEPDIEDPYSISTNLMINDTNYDTNETIVLTPGNTYNMSGTLHGNIIIDATTEEIITAAANDELEYTNIVFNNLKILSDDSYGILYKIPEGGKGFKGISINVEKNSFNYIVCNKPLDLEGETSEEQAEPLNSACIYSMNNLEIQGAGYLALKHNDGCGIKAKETTLANLHLWNNTTDDGVYGKNINIIGGTYYFDMCNNCFNTSDNANADAGHILYYDGEIRYHYLDNKILDSKKQGIYFNSDLISESDLLLCSNMSLISNESFRSYKGWDENVATFTIKQYSNSSDYKKLENGVVLNVSTTTVTSNDNQITAEAYNITATSPLLSIVGYVDKPLYFNTGFGTNMDAEITVNNAFICNSEQNFHTMYYDPSTEKGKIKIRAINDSINIIANTYYHNDDLSFDCDAIKSENNIECEANAGSVLYINSYTSDGIDGSEVKISDTKGNIIISGCGQRGIKGNCIVIGPDASISGGTINSYVTNPALSNYKTVEGIVYVKNNCNVYGASNIVINPNSTEAEQIEQKTITGMADIFARNGKNASKGDFGTTNNELKGYLIIGSLGAIIRANLGNAEHLYYNSTYFSTINRNEINLLNDPGISDESHFAKNIYGTNVD